MVTTRDINYSADGTQMNGTLALPDGTGKRPAILIAHEANGLDDHQRHRAERLAHAGYVAFAMDYHGSGRLYTDATEMMARLTYLGSNPERMRVIVGAALDVVLSEPRTDASRIAAIGYCFGAAMVLELARSGADMKAVVGFHPGAADHDPEDSRLITGKVLMCIGAEDPLMSAADRLAFEEEMRASGVDWQINLYGGTKHSFTHPHASRSGIPGLEYNESVEKRSWRAMLELFDEVFDQ